MYYNFLKEEFKTRNQKTPLKPFQLFELKRIREALKSGNLPRGSWLDDTSIQGPPTQSTAKFKQDDLVWGINQNIDQLKKLFNEDQLYLYDIEYPCGPYGEVDMVFMGKGTIFPVEVKKDQGRHDLIGQIGKYDLFHKLRLHYRLYDFVQSVTICSSYDSFTIKELKKLRIKTLAYSVVDGSLNLKML